MPGFIISQEQSDEIEVSRYFPSASSAGASNQIKPPENVVYAYTWDITKLVKEQVRDNALVYLKTCSFPSYTMDTEDVNTGHALYQFAKGIKWQDVKVSFYDTTGLAKVLNGMSTTVWNKNKGIRLANEYMDQTILNAYFMDSTLAHSWTLHNSWIKSVSFSDLTYETSGPNNADVVVAYTWAELNN